MKTAERHLEGLGRVLLESLFPLVFLYYFVVCPEVLNLPEEPSC